MAYKPDNGKQIWSNNVEQHDKWWRNDERYLSPETLARLENIEDEIEHRADADESGDVE
jgi:hypothetical protein